MITRPKANKPLWIHSKAVGRGYLELDGKRYPIQNDYYAHNHTAEEHVLGVILVAGERGRSLEAMKRIGFLRHDDFYGYENGLIFQAMEGLYQRGDEIDMVTLQTTLARIPFGKSTMLNEIGGEAYLYKLANVIAENIETYARTVVLDSLHRATRLSIQRLEKLLTNSSLAFEDFMLELHRTTTDIQRRLHTVTEHKSYNLYDAMEEHTAQVLRDLDNEDYEVGVPIGYAGFEQVLGAWRKGKLYIFAAPSGWGKTMLLLCFALRALFAGKKVLYLSLEQSEAELYDRLLAIESSVNHDLISKRDKRMNDQERRRMKAASDTIRGAQEAKNFTVKYMNQPTMQQIRTTIETYSLDPGVDLVIIDYANINTISPEDDRIMQGGNADLRLMTHIYKGLEALKKDLDLPIVTGTQMNQDWDKRKGKRPRQNDLYFGSVGVFAADVIAFIFHPAMANPDDTLLPKDLAEIIFRKNRAGRITGDVTVELIYEPQFMRFSDTERQINFLEDGDDE